MPACAVAISPWCDLAQGGEQFGVIRRDGALHTHALAGPRVIEFQTRRVQRLPLENTQGRQKPLRRALGLRKTSAVHLIARDRIAQVR